MQCIGDTLVRVGANTRPLSLCMYSAHNYNHGPSFGMFLFTYAVAAHGIKTIYNC